ncbi:MAG: hypothetical protein WCP85_30385, partial [Mariniphaga sp.]
SARRSGRRGRRFKSGYPDRLKDLKYSRLQSLPDDGRLFYLIKICKITHFLSTFEQKCFTIVSRKIVGFYDYQQYLALQKYLIYTLSIDGRMSKTTSIPLKQKPSRRFRQRGRKQNEFKLMQ